MTTLLPLPALDTFVSTREALHRVAEHVLAKARYVDDGHVQLTAFPGGFATPLLAIGTRVRVEGAELVVDEQSGPRRTPLTTIAEAAAFVGVEPGFPSDLYAPATTLEADRALQVDAAAAQALAAWYGFTAEVLQVFTGNVSDAAPSPVVLWPEHFDQAFFTEDAIESHRANYGASPGDAGHPEPYLYAGPWGTVGANPFWNATTFNGAVLPLSQLVADPDPLATALQFLRAARTLLVAA